MYLVIKHDGLPILALGDGRVKDLAAHISNGYPDLLDDFAAGRITAEEVEVVPALSPYPATEQAVVLRLLLARPFLTYLFELENRVRVLEAKPAITREQFLAAVKTRLGIGG